MTATVCLIIKNEARYVTEWLAHYVSLGFDEIVVYDNGSTDETRAILERSVATLGCISVIDWSDPPTDNPQISAYADALFRCRTEWIAFFDTDELLVLHAHESIGSYLAQAPAQVGAIAVNWLLFGSSGEVSYRPELVARRFRMCAAPNWGKNKFFKTIARVRATSEIAGAHSVKLVPGYYYADNEFREIAFESSSKTAEISHRYAQLNHYVLRSAEEYEQKVMRGNVKFRESHGHKRTKFNAEFWTHHDTNHREDRSVDRWIERAEPILKRIS